MVKLNKIYTKTGDDGTTGLVSGPRRKKHDLRVEAYGTVDETNATVGMARVAAIGMTRIDTVLSRVQNDLFDLGADLATPGPDAEQYHEPLRITEPQVEWLERTIDKFNEELEPLRSFVLPAGTPLSAALHLARTVSRRAERRVAELIEAEPETSAIAMRYLNRLSDLLFVLGRIANGLGKNDVLWEPGRFTGKN
ncbi:cob(I)yrinic acid a,c-diamide adenosyltransferase [Cucumibacter marinus]|uniref:cob(I)yrinic acid a,c-diamide adenosyltransferase n=1 Tax=Cucumibacter marinus TaxID=1121252 RepID=UPI00041C527A|nr:cob(I)yrinic acid a,c-diamide adenosyltransferase [Cucumibacter marinus]